MPRSYWTDHWDKEIKISLQVSTFRSPLKKNLIIFKVCLDDTPRFLGFTIKDFPIFQSTLCQLMFIFINTFTHRTQGENETDLKFRFYESRQLTFQRWFAALNSPRSFVENKGFRGEGRLHTLQKVSYMFPRR